MDDIEKRKEVREKKLQESARKGAENRERERKTNRQ